jgi:hypothetical protein
MTGPPWASKAHRRRRATFPCMATKQFTSNTDLIPFEVNGTHFDAAGTLPADAFIDFLGVVGELGRLGKKAKDEGEGEEEGGGFDIDVLRQQKDLMAEAVRIALVEESAVRFIDGMSDRQNPVSLDLLQEALMWLMEEYKLSKADEDDDGTADEEGAVGDRPTKGTSDSATGSPATGDSSEGD